MVAAARQIATRALHRVFHDDAWAAPALDAELRRAAPRRDDAALATEIVYGTLRVAPELEQTLRRHARRAIKVDDWTRVVLLGAAYQLLHLQRVPPHAVVDDAVGLVSAKRGRRLAGFVNAVLRKVADARPERPAPPSSVIIAPWLEESLHQSIGVDRTEQLCRVGPEPVSIDLRVSAGADREELANAIRAARPDAAVSSTSLSPLGLRVSGAGDPRVLPGYAEGRFAVQEEGAQLIGALLDARPGERVLDACAGRGGKTMQLIEAVGDAGRVVATDLHQHRLEQIDTERSRLKLGAGRLETFCVDWTVGRGEVDGNFDRVLVDAPCTGLGTLRRRPEILLRTKPEDPVRMGQTQARILRNAAALVRVGGALLYAVCSPLSEEGPAVVRSVDLPGFELQVEHAVGLKSLYFGSDGRLDLGPWISGAGPRADAYQIYMWVNVG